MAARLCLLPIDVLEGGAARVEFPEGEIAVADPPHPLLPLALCSLA